MKIFSICLLVEICFLMSPVLSNLFHYLESDDSLHGFPTRLHDVPDIFEG